jgi:alkylation response protein AidB-like acyl-CoA dehydrogenase
MSSPRLDLSRLDHLEPLFAEVGLALETNPAAWARLWEVSALRAIAYIDVPPRFNPYPFSSAGLGYDACPYHVHLALIEYLSRFDASCLMALPGSSLCTRVILTLGTEAQIENFFVRFSSATVPHWTFFAVTEAGVGSDATRMQARLSRCAGGRYLNATKTLIGSVQDASAGLVLARVENTQKLCLVTVEPTRHRENVTCETLASFGLAGAGLCRVVIRELPISDDQVIGAERTSLRDGLPVLLRVFERHRPMVGAMALGAARGLVSAAERAGVSPRTLAIYKLEHAVLCRRMHELALRYERSQLRGDEASLFKLHATRLAERVARSIPALIPSGAYVSSPVLRKKYRDAFAFEYMEGTSNMQLLNAYRQYVASREDHGTAS